MRAPCNIYKTRTFFRWMRKTLLEDRALLLAIEEMERGLVDADLGGGVYKKRVPLPNRGKSGAREQLLRQTGLAVGSTFLVLKKVRGTILTRQNLPI